MPFTAEIMPLAEELAELETQLPFLPENPFLDLDFSVPENSWVADYLQEIHRTPKLTLEEERNLANLASAGDAEARQTLVESTLTLVAQIVYRFQSPTLQLLDLAREGNRGLIMAVDSWKPNYSGSFSAYAWWWILEAIPNTIKLTRTRRISIFFQETLNRLAANQERLANSLGRLPTAEELAVEMDYLPPATISEFLNHLENQSLEDSQVEQLLKVRFEEIKNQLLEIERRIIFRRFGLE